MRHDAPGAMIETVGIERASAKGHEVQLLCYADRLGGDIAGVGRLLAGPLVDFAGVHLLPFFVPFDGDDTGFDPIDHAQVDPRLGGWDDVRDIAAGGRAVLADIIVNHMSADSAEFRDWLARGAASEHDGLFLTFDRVFQGHADEAGITSFYRPRPGLPFTAYAQADGTRRLVWTTFMPSQVDIDVEHPAGEAYLRRVLTALRDGGVSIVRVDAVGYAIKRPGTDSFMTEATLEYVTHLVEMCHELGLEVLVEVHAHYTQQQRIAPLVDYVYDFAIPALVLHAFGHGDTAPLLRWLAERPVNAITVLDTHDGIGIIDAGPIGELPGLIDHDDMAAIFAAADVATGGESGQASVVPQWFTLPHQINATYFSTLGCDATKYLVARLTQFLVPGVPQVYYVGLLAGANDVAEWQRTGQGRDINRHRYTPGEVAAALDTEVVRALLALIRLRTAHPAFEGEFAYAAPGPGRVELSWTLGAERVAAQLDYAEPGFRLSVTTPGGVVTVDSVSQLAEARLTRAER